MTHLINLKFMPEFSYLLTVNIDECREIHILIHVNMMIDIPEYAFQIK